MQKIIKTNASYASQYIENIRLEGIIDVIKNLAGEMTVKKIAEVTELDEKQICQIIKENAFE